MCIRDRVEEGVTAVESNSTPAVDSQYEASNETISEANYKNVHENGNEDQQDADDVHSQEAPFVTQPMSADAISLSDVSQELHIPRSKRVR